MTNEAYSNVSNIIVNLVNAAEDGLGIADIRQALNATGQLPLGRARQPAQPRCVFH